MRPILLALLLSGCASQIMSGYVGKPLTAPMAQYGPPSTAFDMGDGRRAFVWQRGQAHSTGSLGNIYLIGNTAMTYSGPTTVNYGTCNYTVYAEPYVSPPSGPADWKIVGYQAPTLSCE